MKNFTVDEDEFVEIEGDLALIDPKSKGYKKQVNERIISIIKAIAKAQALTLPVPNDEWREKLEVLGKLDFDAQKKAAIFEMRCEQLENLGLVKFNELEDLIDFMKGQPPNKKDSSEGRFNYDYFYNHHCDAFESWGVDGPYIYKYIQKGWFSEKKLWSVKRCFKLDALKMSLPLDLLKAIQIFKEEKVFNTYGALECCNSGSAIIYGLIAEIIPKEGDSNSSVMGKGAFFPIAIF